MIANVILLSVHFGEHNFLVFKFIFIGSMRFLISDLDNMPSTLLRRPKKTNDACMQWFSWPLEHSHSSVQFFKIGFTRVSALTNLPGTVILRVLVLTELGEKVLQVDNPEFEFVLAQTPL